MTRREGNAGVHRASVGACARIVEEPGVRDSRKTTPRAALALLIRRATVRRVSGWRVSVWRVSAGVALLASVAVLGSGGCADQGEGERCTFFKGGDAGENGTSECAAGLLCTVTSYYSTDMVSMGVGTLGVCCPPSGTAATDPACQPTVGGSTTAPPPTGDGGFDAATKDGEAAKDGSHDSTVGS